MQEYLLKLQNSSLSEQDLRNVCQNILEGKYSDVQMAAFLYGLSVRGETSKEIYIFAESLREKATKITSPDGAIDICGTGGDGLNYLNVSTAASFVVASAGVTVAKHGNKSVSSQSGSADIFSKIGIQLDLAPEISEKILKEVGLAFLWAPLYHGAMKFVANVRSELKVRTIFNLLGPLLNPAGVKRQLIGVFSERHLNSLAEALHKLGSERVLLVHGSDGADEITTLGVTEVVELNNGKISNYVLRPDDFDLSVGKKEEIMGKDPEYNSKQLFALLDGKKSTYRDVVIANAAAAFYVAGKVKNFREGAWLAMEMVDSGRAKVKMEELKKVNSRYV